MAGLSFFGRRHLVCFVLLLVCLLSAPSFFEFASAQQQEYRPQVDPPAPPSRFASFFSWLSSRSLLQSLLQRIINHRLARGDVPGAERVKHMIASVDSGIWFWKNAGSLGWDYLIHYSWRNLDPSQIMEVLRLINDIQSTAAELMHFSSDVDRLQWISTNYRRILQLATSVFQKLLQLFDRPGALRSFVLAMQKEIISGDILRDALQLGGADFQGLMQVAKEMFQNYHRPSNAGTQHEL